MLNYDKEAALKDQKFLFTDQENRRLAARNDDLNRDYRDVCGRLQNCESQLKQSEISLKLKEEEKKKEVETLKEHYQKKIQETQNKSSTDGTVMIELEKQKSQWELERQFLQEQVSFSQRQIEENKAMHEALMSAINKKSANKD